MNKKDAVKALNEFYRRQYKENQGQLSAPLNWIRFIFSSFNLFQDQTVKDAARCVKSTPRDGEIDPIVLEAILATAANPHFENPSSNKGRERDLAETTSGGTLASDHPSQPSSAASGSFTEIDHDSRRVSLSETASGFAEIDDVGLGANTTHSAAHQAMAPDPFEALELLQQGTNSTSSSSPYISHEGSITQFSADGFVTHTSRDGSITHISPEGDITEGGNAADHDDGTGAGHTK